MSSCTRLPMPRRPPPPPRGPMYLAINNWHIEIAEMLESKGAKCTKQEAEALGERYTNFCSSIPSWTSPQQRELQHFFGVGQQNDNNLQILTQQLRVSCQENAAKDAVIQQKDEIIQQKDAAIQQQVIVVQQKDEIIQQKDAAIQQQEIVIQQKDAVIQQNNEAIQQNNAAIQQQVIIIQQKDENILQKDATIQQQEIIIQQKDATIQQKDAVIQQKDETIQQKNAAIQQQERVFEQKDAATQEKERIIQQQLLQLESKLLAAQKQQKREHQMQVQLWKFKRSLTQKVKSLADLQFVSTIAHGCDGIVFNCSALKLGIGSVALKILFNCGIDTPFVQFSYKQEYEILKSLPLHINIIPIWNEFQDRPPQHFIARFPIDMQAVVKSVNGTSRSTMCILMPILESFDVFFKREFMNLTVSDKVLFISDILSGLLFLFENDVVHRDMKLNNLLINSSGRIIIADFGLATKLTPNKTIYLKPGSAVGGNPAHLAPEIKKINTCLMQNSVLIDYSKQPSFELGMLAFEIFFGEMPETNKFGEQMDDDYFNQLCLTDSHPDIFAWIRGLLHFDPAKRTGLVGCAEQFKLIQVKF